MTFKEALFAHKRFPRRPYLFVERIPFFQEASISHRTQTVRHTIHTACLSAGVFIEPDIIGRFFVAWITNSEVKAKPSAHRTGSRHYTLTNWVVNFLFKKFFHDCLCKVVRRKFDFA